VTITDSPAKAASPSGKQHGKRRVADARGQWVHVRCNGAEHAAIVAAAAQAGLGAGAYLRSLAIGSAGPRARRRPREGQAELARLLGEIGKVGSNLTQLGSHINDLARTANTSGELPEAVTLAALIGPVREMRDAVMQALGREP
jgi:hypothetical protein